MNKGKKNKKHNAQWKK